MKDIIFEHMATEFPFLARDAVYYYLDNAGELVVKLHDGKTFAYDDIYKTFRRLPDDYNLTEIECKIEFGNRLRRVMAMNGINETTLAEKTGIQRTLISNYISGRTNPSFYAVDKIAKAIGCSVDEFRYIER